jgi:hypothetical protein
MTALVTAGHVKTGRLACDVKAGGTSSINLAWQYKSCMAVSILGALSLPFPLLALPQPCP